MSRAWKLGTPELLAALVAVSWLPTAQAICYIDSFGFEHCNMSAGARAGIAIAILVLGILLVGCAVAARRRRVQRANIAYVTRPPVPQNPIQNSNQGHYQPNPEWQNNNLQYPPQTYAHPVYDPMSGFAPPQGAPPAYYPPAQGSPPPGKEAV